VFLSTDRANSSDAGTTSGDSHKGEGFLRSAWHRIMGSDKEQDGGKRDDSSDDKKSSGSS